MYCLRYMIEEVIQFLKYDGIVARLGMFTGFIAS